MIAGAYERCAKRSRRSNDARCVFQWSQRYSSWKVHHCTKTRFVVYPKHVIYSCCLSTPKVVSVVYSWGTRFFSCFFYKEWLRPSCRLFFFFPGGNVLSQMFRFLFGPPPRRYSYYESAVRRPRLVQRTKFRTGMNKCSAWQSLRFQTIRWPSLNWTV